MIHPTSRIPSTQSPISCRRKTTAERTKATAHTAEPTIVVIAPLTAGPTLGAECRCVNITPPRAPRSSEARRADVHLPAPRVVEFDHRHLGIGVVACKMALGHTPGYDPLIPWTQLQDVT